MWWWNYSFVKKLSLFACWFQSGQTSQPTVISSHNKPAPANPNQPRNQPANRPSILSRSASSAFATSSSRHAILRGATQAFRHVMAIGATKNISFENKK